MEAKLLKKYPTIDLALRTTWNNVVKNYNREAKDYDFSMVMGFALLSIDRKKGTQSTLLGPKMGMEPTSLSRTLKNLEGLQLIERHPNPNDGRSIIIKLTEKGLEARGIVREVVNRFNDTIKEDLGMEKIITFLEVCDRIQYLIENNTIFNRKKTDI